LFPKGTDATLVEKLSRTFPNSQVFKAAPKSFTFSVKHYAGDVIQSKEKKEIERERERVCVCVCVCVYVCVY